MPALRSGGQPGSVQAQVASRAASSDTSANTTSGPTTVAAPPITGPNSTPTIAAPSAEPISSPRRSGGEIPTSQARPPAHIAAPPSPWTKRARSSTTALSAKPKARLETPSSISPPSSVGLTPTRIAIQPDGIEPSSVPAG